MIFFRYLIVGDSKVGKSSILDRFSDNIFTNLYLPTQGIDFKCKNTDDKVCIQIWDTSGEKKFKSLIRLYYTSSECIIIVYDITNKKSFDNIKILLEEINIIDKSINKIIVGNKIDLNIDREVTYLEVKSLADLYNINFHETSAKNNINIKELFYNIYNIIKENNYIDPLEKFTKSQLIKMAKDKNIKVTYHYTKPEIINLINNNL